MNMLKRIGYILCLVIVCQAQVLAQTVTINSLEDAIKLALTRNKDYHNYVLNQSHAELEYKQVKSYRLPSISGSFSGQKNMDLATTPLPGEIFGQPEQTIEAQFGQEYTYNAGISISKQLLNREAAIQTRISKLNVEMMETEKEAFEELLKEQVSLYFYTGLIAKRSIEIGKQDLQIAKDVNQLSKGKFEEGVVDGITLNTAAINLNAVKQNLIASEQLIIECHIELKKLFGMSATDSLNIKGELNYELPKAYSVEQLRLDPALKNATLRLQQSEMQVKYNRASLLPSLQLNTYYGKQQFRDDFGFSFSGEDWSNYSYISLGLSVPLFTGFNNRLEIKQGKVNQQIAFNEQQEAENFAVLNDQKLIADYEFSRREGMAILETFKLYKENLNLTLEKYEAGLVSLDNYLTVFQDYLKAENTYLNAQSKIYTYYSQIISRIE